MHTYITVPCKHSPIWEVSNLGFAFLSCFPFVNISCLLTVHTWHGFYILPLPTQQLSFQKFLSRAMSTWSLTIQHLGTLFNSIGKVWLCLIFIHTESLFENWVICSPTVLTAVQSHATSQHLHSEVRVREYRPSALTLAVFVLGPH